ncbi:MAG TPA: SEC-C domain-containing protein [Pseudonocardiaceae bacterium]
MTENDVEDELSIDVDTLVGMLTGEDPPAGDQIRFVLDALSFASDDALTYLSGRIECHTAHGGGIEPQLAALRSQARSREEKAAAALIGARAAEGAGDPGTARDLLTEALTVRPGLEPALHDAAHYAAVRGDYATADRYLRRAERESPLRAGLSEAIAAAPDNVGRNAPCPCGSGRKFKTCCLRDALPALNARAQLLYAFLGTYAERPPQLEMVTSLVERAGDEQRHAMFLLDLALFHGGLVERFLASRGGWLRPEERELIESWRQIPVTLYETLEVTRGASVTLRPLSGGEAIHLDDVLFSQSAQRLELFCGRVLHDGAVPRLLALPVHIPRHRRRELLDLLGSKPSLEQIADFLAPEPPVRLRNSDGDALHDCGVTYQVPEDQRAFEELAAQLSQTGDEVISWQRPLPDGRVLSLGQIHRCGQEFTVIANSPQRLAKLETTLLDAAPGAVEQDRHATPLSEQDPAGRQGRAVIVESYFLGATGSDSAATERVSRDAETNWLDTSGVIGTLSPREAAASDDPAVRTELCSTIDDVEATLLQTQRAGAPTSGLMDPQRLRDALGIGGRVG